MLSQSFKQVSAPFSAVVGVAHLLHALDDCVPVKVSVTPPWIGHGEKTEMVAPHLQAWIDGKSWNCRSRWGTGIVTDGNKVEVFKNRLAGWRLVFMSGATEEGGFPGVGKGDAIGVLSVFLRSIGVQVFWARDDGPWLRVSLREYRNGADGPSCESSDTARSSSGCLGPRGGPLALGIVAIELRLAAARDGAVWWANVIVSTAEGAELSADDGVPHLLEGR